jgi:hypothetical protein
MKSYVCQQCFGGLLKSKTTSQMTAACAHQYAEYQEDERVPNNHVANGIQHLDPANVPTHDEQQQQHNR